MTTFDALGLSAPLLRAVEAQGFTAPTAIQARAIPPLIAGRDMIGIAQTGEGKTAAYLLPIVNRLIENGEAVTGPIPHRPLVLILAPTRELASQIGDFLRLFSKGMRLYYTVIFGGTSFQTQRKVLERGVQILVATPGRLMDHISRHTINLDHVQALVLDEADRMLDMGFIETVKEVAAMLPAAHQTIMFSATMNRGVRALAEGLLREPEEISLGRENSVAPTVDHRVMRVKHFDKKPLLMHLLGKPEISRVLVFTRTKAMADDLAHDVREAGHPVGVIHGDHEQSERQRVLKSFRDGEINILTATDVAARGIDVPDITHVINFDMPLEGDGYVHRVGRTGRAGAKGVALSICDSGEGHLLRMVEQVIGQSIPVDTDQPFHTNAATAPRRDPRRGGGGKRFDGNREFKRDDKPRDFKRRDDKPRDFKPRDDKPREFRPRDDKPREFKPRDDKPREYKPRDDRPRDFKARDDNQSREFKPREDRPRDDRPRDDKPRDFKPREFKPRDEQSRDFKPRDDRPRDDKPRDFKPREDRPYKGKDERPFKAREDRPFKAREDRPYKGPYKDKGEGFKGREDRPYKGKGERSFEPRDGQEHAAPRGEHHQPAGAHTAGERPAWKKHERADAPRGERHGEHRGEGRFERKFEGKKNWQKDGPKPWQKKDGRTDERGERAHAGGHATGAHATGAHATGERPTWKKNDRADAPRGDRQSERQSERKFDRKPERKFDHSERPAKGDPLAVELAELTRQVKAGELYKKRSENRRRGPDGAATTFTRETKRSDTGGQKKAWGADRGATSERKFDGGNKPRSRKPGGSWKA